MALPAQRHGALARIPAGSNGRMPIVDYGLHSILCQNGLVRVTIEAPTPDRH